jgi:dTMP kinase
MKGLFIVFEGIDGSGTSTQSQLLNNHFLNTGKVCYTTCEPSDGPVGTLIRQAFKGRTTLSKGPNPFFSNGDLFDEQMAYLFAADRHDHLFNDVDGVIPLKAKGAIVISTRYYFSSLAYHCNSSTDYEMVKSLNARFPEPDLVVYFDNKVSESIKRMSNRAFKDEYENANKLNIVKSNYDKIFSDYKGELLVVDASLPRQEIHQLIIKKSEGILKNAKES